MNNQNYETLISHYSYDINYPILGFNKIAQTNIKIEQILNTILNYLRKNKKENYIIEYNDDIFSFINLRIASIIESLYPIKVYCYGRKTFTGKHIKENMKFISHSKLKYFMKHDNTSIFISSYNLIKDTMLPLKEVKDKYIFFNEKIYINILFPLMDLTPIDVDIIKIFYNIPILKKDNFSILKDLKLFKIQKWILGEEYYPEINYNNPSKINIIIFSENIENNNKLIEETYSSSEPYCYFINENIINQENLNETYKNQKNKIIFLFYNYNHYIKENYNKINKTTLIFYNKENYADKIEELKKYCNNINIIKGE